MALSRYTKPRDVLLRSVILGLLDLLYEKIQILPVEEGDVPFRVPVFFAMSSGDERFLQDTFLFPDACKDVFANGSYDVIPRGTLMMPSVNIKESDFVNPYVRGSYQQITDSEVLEKSSPIFMIPIEMSFNLEFVADQYLELWIIYEQLLSAFRRVSQFKVQWKGMALPCNVTLNSSRTLTKQDTFQFSGVEHPKLSTSLSLETYQPVFDSWNDRFSYERMVDPQLQLDEDVTAWQLETRNAANNPHSGTQDYLPGSDDLNFFSR
jgi:hypothetical protein